MRATIHNGRIGLYGAYNPKHNDRNFNTEAEHIDSTQSKENIYWNCFDDPNLTFEQVEKKFYEEHFQEHLNSQNARYQRQRHTERMKNMDAYRTSRRTCPEETILAIGNKDFHIPPRTLMDICIEFMNWEQKEFPGLHVLNMALHIDERGVPHIHERKVWIYTDKEGHEAVGQEKVLQKNGIELPHPEKPKSRYNNRKQTFSKIAREKFFSICKEHGIYSLLETKPRERSKSGQELTEYKAKQAENRAKAATAKTQSAEKRLSQINKELSQVNKETEKTLSELYQLKDFLHLAEQRKLFEIFKERERTR